MKAVFGGMIGAALLCAGAANAADLAVPAYKAPVAVPAFSWTGWYIGGNIGGGWGENTSSNVTLGGVDLNAAGLDTSFLNSKPNGIIGGAQIGYDWQVNHSWVAGVVADFQGANIQGSGGASASGFIPGFGPVEASATATENLRYLGTVRGRLGWTTGNWMLYGSGGLAYGSVNSTETVSVSGQGQTVDLSSAANSETRFGWAGGVGVNYAMTQNWIVGVDYLHYDLGRTSVTDPTAQLTVDQKVGGDIVRGVLNYKF